MSALIVIAVALWLAIWLGEPARPSRHLPRPKPYKDVYGPDNLDDRDLNGVPLDTNREG